MSARYVRNTFRGWCGTLAIPFYDTINFHQNPKDDLWCTVMFDPAQRTRLTFCDHQEEDGEIELMLCGKPGIGDDIVIEALENAVDVIMSKADALGRFVITDYGPIEDASFGDADTTYRCSTRFQYVFYPELD